MKKTLMTAALLAGGALLAGPSFAQTASPPNAQPTVKDRVDGTISPLTGNPLANADVDMKHVLDALADLKPKPIETLEPAEARQQPTPADGVKALLQKEGKSAAPQPGVTVQTLSYPTAGGTQPARVYKPEGATGALPIVVYYHGGGWVIADLDTYDATPRAMAKQANAIVVSAEYRHAPEAKFPAAHDDAVAAYKWSLANAKEWGGDPARMAVMGESAGGNLAINVAIAARDQKLQMPLAEVLVYPVAGVDMGTPSYTANASAKPLNKPMMEWFVKHTLPNDAAKQDPRIDLVGKADVSNLPPTTIITAQIDPLQSEGQMLGEKLRKAGVSVSEKDYDGVTHEFFGMAPVVAKAKEAQAFAAQQLKAAFTETTASGKAKK